MKKIEAVLTSEGLDVMEGLLIERRTGEAAVKVSYAGTEHGEIVTDLYDGNSIRLLKHDNPQFQNAEVDAEGYEIKSEWLQFIRRTFKEFQA